MQVLVLLSDAFGGFGGISRYNRDFLTAISGSPVVDRVRVWPRIMSEPLRELIPETTVFETKFANNKLRYIFYAARSLLSRPRIDLVVCAHINLLGLSWLISKLCGAPLVLVIFGIEAWSPTRSPVINHLARRITSLVSISEFTANRFAEWSGVDLERCTILPCCVDVARFTPGPKNDDLARRYGLSDNGPILLTLGRLAAEERYKGFDEVLDVMPRLVEGHPDLQYVICGDGPDLPRLRLKVKIAGVDQNVVFTGRIDEAEKVDLYRLADLFVMPSSGEGFGIVLIEAAACGLPVIGSKVDGTSEALLNGHIGTLVDPERPDELVEAIEAALPSAKGRERTPHPLVKTFDVSPFNERAWAWIKTFAET